MTIAGILRSVSFSPNNVGADAAILNATAAELRSRGFPVNIYSEEQFIAHGIGSEPIIMTMTRDTRSISRLQMLENEGRIVVNSAMGIAHCVRGNMVRIFERENIPQPPTLVVNTNEDVLELLRREGIDRCWVKRADCQTIHKEDVVRTRHAREAQEMLSEFFIRGIKSATIAAHINGLHVKFYGVDSTPEFFHYYFTDGNPTVPAAFSSDALQAACRKAARVLGVTIYGGDAMINPDDGTFRIISFNDWPGFAPCRKAAAKAIFKHVATFARKLSKR